MKTTTLFFMFTMSILSPLAHAALEVVSLETDTYARATPDFRTQLAEDYWNGKPTNVLGVVKTGTEAEVIDRSPTPEGNEAVKVRIRSGKLKGKICYVFNKKSRESLRPLENADEQIEAAQTTPCDLGQCEPKKKDSFSDLAAAVHAIEFKLPTPKKAPQPAPRLASRPSAPTTPTIPTATTAQFTAINWDGHSRGSEYEGYISQALDQYGQDLLKTIPKDIQTFCPSYASFSPNQRKHFWVQFVAALAKQESQYQNKSKNTESWGDVSTGLLQLSISSSKNTAKCPLKSSQDLQDPQTNLECGVRWLNRLVGKHQIISARNPNENPDNRWDNWLGATAHWAVLKPIYTGKYKYLGESLDIIRRKTTTLCQSMSPQSTRTYTATLE